MNFLLITSFVVYNNLNHQFWSCSDFWSCSYFWSFSTLLSLTPLSAKWFSESDSGSSYLIKCWFFWLKHSRQSTVYDSAPPINYFDLLSTIRWLKLASKPQLIHTAVSLMISSARGTKSRICCQAYLSYVPFKADTITIFPWLAALSANSHVSS